MRKFYKVKDPDAHHRFQREQAKIDFETNIIQTIMTAGQTPPNQDPEENKEIVRFKNK